MASGPGVLGLCGVGPELRGPLPPMAPSLILRGGLPPCHASPTTTSHISSILPLSSEGIHGGSQALLLPSTVPQEMSPCSRNVGAPAPEAGCPCRCPRLLEAALCLPCPPLGPASLPCFCPLLPSQGWTGTDVIRQGRWSASAVSSVVTAGAVGAFRFVHHPRQEKGPLISGEGYPGILRPCPLVLHEVPPPSVAEPHRLRCPSLLQWACPLAALPALRCALGSSPHSCPASPPRIRTMPTPTPSTVSLTALTCPSPGNVLSNWPASYKCGSFFLLLCLS